MAAPPPPVLPPYGRPSSALAAPYGGAAPQHAPEGHPYAPHGHFPFHPGAWPLGHHPNAHWPMAGAHQQAAHAGGFGQPGQPQPAPASHGYPSMPAPPAHHSPAAAHPAPRGPLAALMLAVEQSAQEEGEGHRQPHQQPHQQQPDARGAKRARPVGGSGSGSSLAVDSQWYPSSSSGVSSATSSPTSSVGSVNEGGKIGHGHGHGGHAATGAGALSRRGRRKGSKDGWNAAGAAALASEEDRVGLLPGVHTANLDKYMPAKEKVKRTRTVLAGMSCEEKTERRKERARKYSQDLRKRQLESIQELLIEARRLNVFQLLVQESADLLLVLAPLGTPGTDGAVVLFANAAAEGVLLGKGKAGKGAGQALLGQGLLAFMHPEDRAAVVEALKRASAAKEAGRERVRCRLLQGAGAAEGAATEVDLLLREGTQGVVCNGRVVE